MFQDDVFGMKWVLRGLIQGTRSCTGCSTGGPPPSTGQRGPWERVISAEPKGHDPPRLSGFLGGLSVPAVTCPEPRRSGVRAAEARPSSFVPLQEGRPLLVGPGRGSPPRPCRRSAAGSYGSGSAPMSATIGCLADMCTQPTARFDAPRLIRPVRSKSSRRSAGRRRRAPASPGAIEPSGRASASSRPTRAS